MSEELNTKQNLLFKTLASVREKLDKVTVIQGSLLKVKGAYRFIFNDSNNRYGLGEDLTEEEVKEQLERDILTKDCGIDSLDDFLDKMGSCWLDFFGSDSFSDSKKKQQVFFATLCKDKDASDYRKKHVDNYNRFLNIKVPVDVFIQLFFVSDENTKLKEVQSKGLFIDFLGASSNPAYYSVIENSSYDKQDLLKTLVEKLEKGEDIFKLNYSQLNDQNQEEHFIKSVCDLNKSLHEEVKYVYFLPIPCPDGSNGLVCFGTKEPLDSEDRSLLNALSFDILYPFVSSYKTAWQYRRIQIECIKAAVAALMARNLSHNIGSHPLTNTKSDFRNTVNVIQGLNEIKKELVNRIAADYRGNARLLQYVQERMDFIATIISGDQYPLGGLNFKAEFFDILTNDDCGARHGKDEKNFLLQYLLYSENLTRHHGLGEDAISANMDEVNLVVKYQEGQYTGKVKVIKDGKDVIVKEEESKIKLDLSKLRLAVPGGVMARHAMFTIVENILRNSAKHNKRKEKEDLVLTIKIEEDNGKYKLYFYDNCNSANEKVKVDKKNEKGETRTEEKTVIDLIRGKLDDITIIGGDSKIDKKDKGLKEMLFCAIWLKNEDLAETLVDIQNKEVKATKYLDVIKVDKDGNWITKKDNNGNDVENENIEGNLCYVIDLEMWQDYAYLDDIDGKGKSILGDIEYVKNEDASEVYKARIKRDDLLKIHADFVVAKQDYFIKLKEDDSESEGKKLSRIFPSFIALGELTDVKKRIKDVQDKLINEYNLVIKYSGGIKTGLPPHVFNYDESTWNSSNEQHKNKLFFYDHILNEGNKGVLSEDIFRTAEYFDSISGENFTQTLTEPDFLGDSNLLYKVIRSAKAKIAIVDERIWENYVKLNKSLAQNEEKKKTIEDLLEKEEIFDKNFFDSLRIIVGEKESQKLAGAIRENALWKKASMDEKKGIIRDLMDNSSNDPVPKTDETVILLKKKNISIFTMEGGRFKDIENNETNKLTDFDFVSIHLGLLDKGDKKDFDSNFFKIFGSKPFISIHSGRGNFSPDLEDKLKDYPFISLSALESALNNSKYLLSEFLYNTNYYGKGNINN